MNEESRLVNLLSDTVLYDDAMAFVNEHPELPDMRQLIGLSSFSEKWADLLAYIKHQAGRDWGSKTHYKTFYDALRKYLETELRQGVKTEFNLVDEGLSRKEEKAVLDKWAELLAQEFVQHLVAEARLRKN